MQNKHCYLCGENQLSKRVRSVRDNTNLSILECDGYSLVFFLINHISDDLYEDGNA